MDAGLKFRGMRTKAQPVGGELPGLFDPAPVSRRAVGLRVPAEERRGEVQGAPKVVGVSELTSSIKGQLEPAFSNVWVRGEISNLRRQSSGHLYFSLKDAGSQIACVMFRMDAGRLKFDPQDGQAVVASGRLTIYEPRGNYQLVLNHLEQDGVGRLQAEFERLKGKLAREGLFEAARKKSLPPYPRCVGFVTSSSGAALRDFVSILQRRQWRGRLIVLPARVQGKEAATEIVQRLEWAGASGLFDLLVVGRGGGSLEDLWPFNEEIVARAVAACPIPVISAVGHEIDFTLSDFAADWRAETPSAAAERITSGYLEIVRRYGEGRDRLFACAGLLLERRRGLLERLALRLDRQSPYKRVENGYLRLDDLGNRLRAAVARQLEGRRHRLGAAGQRLSAEGLSRRLVVYGQHLEQLSLRLDSASPQSVLKRGFVMIRDGDGNYLTRREQVGKGQVVQACFADGALSLQDRED